MKRTTVNAEIAERAEPAVLGGLSALCVDRRVFED
jgi:hypothetical protein